MKKWLLVSLFCAMGLALSAQTPAPAAAPAAAPAVPAAKFSLEEERYVTAFQKEGQAKFEKAVEDAVGKKIAVEIDFPSFAGHFDSMKYVEGQWCTDVVVDALKAVCTDDIGKRRVGEKVQKIVIRHDDAATQDSYTLADGTLTILTNLASSGVNRSNLVSLLEKSI